MMERRTRRDAELNRERLLMAGRLAMRDHGGDLPVERICELAQVTRGTFYRNFPDRASIYAAVLDYELNVMEETLSRPATDPKNFLYLLIEMMTVYDKFMCALPDMEFFRDDGSNEAKIVSAIENSLGQAKACGLIATDISGHDVMLACRMIVGDWRLDGASSREQAIERRLTLMMRGLSTGTGPA